MSILFIKFWHILKYYVIIHTEQAERGRKLKLKLGIITSEPHLDYLKTIEEEYQDICEFNYLLYSNFSEVGNLYRDNETKMDGFILTGYLIQLALEQENFNINKPIYILDEVENIFFKELVSLLISNQNIDLSRLYIDFTSYTDSDNDIIKIFSKTDKKPYFLPVKVEKADFISNAVLNNHINLWNEGRIDLSFTALGNLMPELIKRGIRAKFIHPSPDYSREIFSKAINEISLSMLQEDRLVVAMISFDGAKDEDFDSSLIKDTIIEFLSKYNFSHRTIKNDNHYEVYTNYKSFKILTDNMSSCSLVAYLCEKFNIEVNVGWGFGTDPYKSLLNAKLAHTQALSLEGSNSFYVDNKSNIIGPLNQKYTLAYKHYADDEILELSEKVGVNTINLQKIISYAHIVGTNKFNSLEISKCLVMTLKGANRILNQIEQEGYATATYEKHDSKKGRPSKYFILSFIDENGEFISIV